MEKNNSVDSWFNFKPMVGGRITSGARKHKLFNEVRLVIGDELGETHNSYLINTIRFTMFEVVHLRLDPV